MEVKKMISYSYIVDRTREVTNMKYESPIRLGCWVKKRELLDSLRSLEE